MDTTTLRTFIALAQIKNFTKRHNSSSSHNRRSPTASATWKWNWACPYSSAATSKST